MIIKLYTLILFAACEGANTEINTAGTACVCVADAYQTNADQSDQPLQCAACPFGSTTGTNTNPQGIDACGKNGKLIIPID